MGKDKLKVVTEYHKIRHQLHMPTKAHKNKKRYNRKDKNWKKEDE